MKRNPLRITSAFVVFLLVIAVAGPWAWVQAQEKDLIKDVKIAGNVRVEDEGIRLHLKNRPGGAYDPNLVEQDVKAIFRMGFFDDVRAELT
ncbi:MAG TPA: POTRA domain-containing protein, partial [Candidatus Binatia bacterium]|nr:POTRA domain-containing protein [Candidatus Binatia bacterium]